MDELGHEGQILHTGRGFHTTGHIDRGGMRLRDGGGDGLRRETAGENDALVREALGRLHGEIPGEGMSRAAIHAGIVGIEQHIGRRPIAAFGNSDGDLQMLQWTAAGPGSRFCLYVHHTDAAREFAYDRESHIGKLDKGLDEAATKGWTVVSMKDDWRLVHPPLR